MMLEKAIKLLKQYQGYDPMFPDGETLKHAFDLTDETVDTLLSALRPISREQVEKVWKGEWEWFDETVGTPIDGYEREWGWQCSKCKTVLPDEFDNPDDSPAMRFCQWCGAPMTDEAVDMVMERLEALRDEKD